MLLCENVTALAIIERDTVRLNIIIHAQKEANVRTKRRNFFDARVLVTSNPR